MVIYSVIHKRVFTPLRDLPTRIIEAIDHSSNSTMAFAFTKNPGIFCKCKCHCWVWRMVDSLYYSSRKISERCENSFLDYRIYYQKLCYLMRQITKDLNWPTVYTRHCKPIRRRSYVIIGFVAPAIGPNKSKKLTRLISPTHNTRGKVWMKNNIHTCTWLHRQCHEWHVAEKMNQSNHGRGKLAMQGGHEGNTLHT